MKKHIEINIKGMSCGACEKIISMELGDLAGTDVKEISAQKGEAKITFDSNEISEQEIIKVIEDLGYEAKISTAGEENE